MWWRAGVIRMTVLVAAITSLITLVLICMMLIPAIVDGPANKKSLVRTECIVQSAEIFQQFCSRDTSSDFSGLTYQSDWFECYLITFNITTNYEKSCLMRSPDIFNDRDEATTAIENKYPMGTNFNCVVDTIDDLCYRDKLEVMIFIIAVAGLFCITLCLSGCYVYLLKCWKK